MGDLSVLWGSAFRGLSHGFVRVPVGATAMMKSAGLSAEEILFVQALQSFRRDTAPERNPFPGTERLAAMLSIDRSTVVRMADRLERRGHLRIIRGEKGRGKSNQYDLSPLLLRLAELAPSNDPPSRLAATNKLKTEVDTLRREYAELEGVVQNARATGNQNREAAALERQLDIQDRLDTLGAAVTTKTEE